MQKMCRKRLEKEGNMNEVKWNDLLMALKRANTFASELNVEDKLPDSVLETIQDVYVKVKKAKKKEYEG